MNDEKLQQIETTLAHQDLQIDEKLQQIETTLAHQDLQIQDLTLPAHLDLPAFSTLTNSHKTHNPAFTPRV